MKACALLGGPKSAWPDDLRQQLQAAQAAGNLLIGVDRGSLLLLELGLVPDLALGDFDSLQAAELRQVTSQVPDIRYSNPVKDDTDSEVMIKAAFCDYQVSQLTLFGATGGRLDHALVNLLTVLQPDFRPWARHIAICDRQNLIHFYTPGVWTVSAAGYPYFGVANLLAVKGLTISGARYSLTRYQGDYPRMFASNEFLPDQPTFQLQLKAGLVAVIYSRDLVRFDHVNKKKSNR